MTRLRSVHAPAFALVFALGCSPATYSEANTTVADHSDSSQESETAGDTVSEAGDGSADAGCMIGSDGCPCTPGGGCDPGLMCDAGVCSGCLVGSEGCPCTSGGGCDPGLMCDAGVCLPGATTGDGDPTGDGDTTGDGDGDPLMCGMFQRGCDVADPELCLCEGCNNNGQCTQDEDCVCPDCTQKDFCVGEACTDNGVCSPYFEGCSCSDCADHVMC